jgi:hypothetical protein
MGAMATYGEIGEIETYTQVYTNGERIRMVYGKIEMLRYSLP